MLSHEQGLSLNSDLPSIWIIQALSMTAAEWKYLRPWNTIETMSAGGETANSALFEQEQIMHDLEP